MHNKTVQDFLSRVSDPKEQSVLDALGLAPRQMELFLAVLNALPEDSLIIPDMAKITKDVGVSSPYIQELKKKKLICRGPKRGEWLVTERAIKKMDSFLKNEPFSDAPTPDKKTGVRTKVKAKKYDISQMSLADIRKRLEEINEEIQSLEKERSSMKIQIRDQLALLK